MFNSIRKMANTRKIPTPNATANINTRLGTDGTCSASTCKSGSDMVMTKPMMKLTNTTISTFFVLVIIVPVRSPMGVMEISTPTLNKSIPAISSTAPTRNVIRILGGMGAMVKQSSNTMPRMGKTAFRVSLSFSLNFECKNDNV